MVNENESTASYVQREFGHGDVTLYSELFHLSSTLQSSLILNTLNLRKIDWNSSRDAFIMHLNNINGNLKEEELIYSEDIEKLIELANQELWNEKVVKEMDAIIFQIILKLQGNYKGEETSTIG